MQAEFRADEIEAIDFLAINGADQDSGVEAATAGVTLPLLEDTASDDVWSAWNAEWRDLVILDGSQNEVNRINLTDHDLGDSENYAALKEDLEALVDGL